jgi:inositol phosphorylceramide mannosyltransferase catalytic subunit
MIPKIIHQTWIVDNKWKSKNMPEIFEKIYNKNQEINKGYEYKLWNDNVEEILEKEYPKLYEIYNKTILGVQKSDISRLVILHKYGGIYMDLDILLVKSLDNLLDYNSDQLYFGYEPKEQTEYLYKSDKYICNAFIASPKNNVLILNMINTIIETYNNHGNIIFKKFNIFGSDIFKYIINNSDNNLYEIIDRELIYPINDIKFDMLPSSEDDYKLIRDGICKDKIYMIHYWIHSGFEGKEVLENYKYKNDKTIEMNIFDFMSLLYPNNKYIKND